MKLVSENIARGGETPTEIIYKRSHWSPKAALESIVFTTLITSLLSWVLHSYENGSLIDSPEAIRNFVIFGGAAMVAMGFMVYSMRKEQSCHRATDRPLAGDI